MANCDRPRDIAVAPQVCGCTAFDFTGCIIARALIEGVNVAVHLTTAVLKQLVGCKLSLRDLEDIEGEKHVVLKALLDSEGKQDFVDLEAEQYVMECMGSSLEAVCVGFHAILPLEAVVWFTHDELDPLISELRESTLCKECNATY